MMRLDFPGIIVASGRYPWYLAHGEENICARSCCNFGFVVFDFVKKEAHIIEVELFNPYLGNSFSERDNWKVTSTKINPTPLEYLMEL